MFLSNEQINNKKKAKALFEALPDKAGLKIEGLSFMFRTQRKLVSILEFFSFRHKPVEKAFEEALKFRFDNYYFSFHKEVDIDDTSKRGSH